MASAVIKKCTIAELEAAPNIQEILDEYAAESSVKGLPAPKAKVEIYKEMEGNGALHVLAAYVGDLLVGYFCVLAPVLPHYGILIAVGESYFVSKAYRNTGAGLKLLREAELLSNLIGSPGLFISAVIGSDLAELLPNVGYRETNRVFFRSFKNE